MIGTIWNGRRLPLRLRNPRVLLLPRLHLSPTEEEEEEETRRRSSPSLLSPRSLRLLPLPLRKLLLQSPPLPLLRLRVRLKERTRGKETRANPSRNRYQCSVSFLSIIFLLLPLSVLTFVSYPAATVSDLEDDDELRVCEFEVSLFLFLESSFSDQCSRESLQCVLRTRKSWRGSVKKPFRRRRSSRKSSVSPHFNLVTRFDSKKLNLPDYPDLSYQTSKLLPPPLTYTSFCY